MNWDEAIELLEKKRLVNVQSNATLSGDEVQELIDCLRWLKHYEKFQVEKLVEALNDKEEEANRADFWRKNAEQLNARIQDIEQNYVLVPKKF